jgi:hypothetical protein
MNAIAFTREERALARVSKDGNAHRSQPMVRDAPLALLTMRLRSILRFDDNSVLYATWLCVSVAYSGSASQMTRLRPLRLAA